MTAELWFFALFPPADIALRAAALAPKPARAEKMHITLLVPAHPVDAAALQRAGEMVRMDGFDIVLDRMERGFGSSQAHILSPDESSWRALDALHARVRDAVKTHGIALLREDYRPHLTLSRETPDAAVVAIEPLQWRANAFRLMRSLRAEQRYVVEGEWPLG